MLDMPVRRGCLERGEDRRCPARGRRCGRVVSGGPVVLVLVVVVMFPGRRLRDAVVAVMVGMLALTSVNVREIATAVAVDLDRGARRYGDRQEKEQERRGPESMRLLRAACGPSPGFEHAQNVPTHHLPVTCGTGGGAPPSEMIDSPTSVRPRVTHGQTI